MAHFGYKAVFSIYSSKLLWKSSILPLGITMVLNTVILFSDINPYKLLLPLVENTLSIVPGLLGFVLAGYALLIGYGSSEFIKFLSADNNDVFKKLNSTFAMSIYVQVITLTIGIIMNLILKTDIIKLYCGINSTICYYCMFIIMSFGLFWSIFTIKDMTINVFNFGQLRHYQINKKDNYKNN